MLEQATQKSSVKLKSNLNKIKSLLQKLSSQTLVVLLRNQFKNLKISSFKHHYLKQLQVNPTMQHREISVKTFDTIFFHGGYPTVRNRKLGSSWKVKEGKSMMHLLVAHQIR